MSSNPLYIKFQDCRQQIDSSLEETFSTLKQGNLLKILFNSGYHELHLLLGADCEPVWLIFMPFLPIQSNLLMDAQLLRYVEPKTFSLHLLLGFLISNISWKHNFDSSNLLIIWHGLRVLLWILSNRGGLEVVWRRVDIFFFPPNQAMSSNETHYMILKHLNAI